MGVIIDMLETNTHIPYETDRQKDIDTIDKMLRHETIKKLESIQFHLMYHHQIGIIIREKNDLFTFLNSDDATEEIVWGILELLNQSFSRGYPNYIYEYELRSD